MDKDYLTVHSYGDQQGLRPHLVMTVPHDGDGLEFLKPESRARLRSAIPADDETLAAFLGIERDVGSFELAQAVAKILAERTSGAFRSRIVRIGFPRGILDGNRVSDMAVRNVFQPDSDGVTGVLGGIHKRTIADVAQIINDIHPNGMFMDVHTMAPFTPVRTVGETPDGLKDYVRAYTDPRGRGARRGTAAAT